MKNAKRKRTADIIDTASNIDYNTIMEVTIQEAKFNLSRLIAAAERGEEVIIARPNKPGVRIVSVHPKRNIGSLTGQLPAEKQDHLSKEPKCD
jgi:prevent-host-death family protein